MKHLSFAASVFVLSATLSAAPALASPMHPVAPAPHTAAVNVLCKYGTPNCVNPNPGPKPPKVGGVKWPDSGWQDPDCKHYGNCGTGTPGNWGDPAAARSGPSEPQWPAMMYR